MTPPGSAARAIALSALAIALAAAGCASRTTLEYIADGAPTTIARVEASAETADLSPVASIDAEDAPDARVDTLVWLRGQGTDGERAATLLTQGFPDRTAAVPVRVEFADVDGVRSLIVVEAYGGTTGPLERRRLWVFDLATGGITRSATY